LTTTARPSSAGCVFIAWPSNDGFLGIKNKTKTNNSDKI
jgi:hypothetical protein